jgi:hypothetical protein
MASPKRRILKASSLETQLSTAELTCTHWSLFSNMFRGFKETWNEAMTGRCSSYFTEVANLLRAVRARSNQLDRLVSLAETFAIPVHFFKLPVARFVVTTKSNVMKPDKTAQFLCSWTHQLAS